MSSGRPGREASAPPVTLCEVIEEGSKAAPPPRSLVLRLKPKSAVRWEEGTVDNEGCGRKSSKRKCAAADRPSHRLPPPLFSRQTTDRRLTPFNFTSFLLPFQAAAFSTDERLSMRVIQTRATQTSRRQSARRRRAVLRPSSVTTSGTMPRAHRTLPSGAGSYNEESKTYSISLQSYRPVLLRHYPRGLRPSPRTCVLHSCGLRGATSSLGI